MIESEGRKGNVGGDIKPSDRGGVSLRGEFVAVAGGEPVIEDGGGMSTGVAAWGADGSNPFEEKPGDAGFLLEFAEGSSLEVLILVDESAGQGPGTAEGLLAPFDEEDAKAEVLKGARDREQDDVNRDGRTGPRVAISPFDHQFSM